MSPEALRPGEVRFEDVVKEYRLGRPRAFLAAALPWGTGVGRGETLRVLDDLNFSIEPGEAFALIGSNGAGKSTALKCLAGVVAPTSGRVRHGGRVVALIELGIGFHPDLTGWENAKFAVAMNGIRGKQAKDVVDAAIEFSELQKFIGTPVKRYSSGMYARLSFGVAANLPADILIVDEVLAVGDLAFQRKCFAHLASLRKESGVTLFFVSHNDFALKETCNRGVLLSHGRVTAEGPVGSLLDAYHAAPDGIREGTQAGGIMTFARVELDPAGTRSIDLHGLMTVEIEVTVREEAEQPVLGLAWANGDRQLLWASYSDEAGLELPAGRHTVRVVVPDVTAMPGHNQLQVLAFDRRAPVLEQSRVFDIDVAGKARPSGNWGHGLVDVPATWAITA
jgi:lipopolysaccharide transport system ATP-binding protein